jgi:hypothetical protein
MVSKGSCGMDGTVGLVRLNAKVNLKPDAIGTLCDGFVNLYSRS